MPSVSCSSDLPAPLCLSAAETLYPFFAGPVEVSRLTIRP
jgi:hypothetical protein